MTFNDCINMGGTLNECNAITQPPLVPLIIGAMVLTAAAILATIIFIKVKKS